MTTNKGSNPLQAQLNFAKRLWDRLTAPSPRIADVGDQRSAQLSASFLLIITLLNLAGAFARIPRLGFIAAFGSNFGISIATSLVAYGIARTRWYRGAIFLFAFSFSSTAYISIIEQGNGANFSALVFVYVPLSLIVASNFLSPWALFLLTGLNIGGMLITQFYGVSLPANIGAIAGITTTIGLVLIALTNFRNDLENYRLAEMFTVNQELEKLTSSLEERVKERTDELESAKQQTEERATQLQAITELSEVISQIQDINELFPATTKLISERFGFYHVGIFLIDSDHESAVLQAANSEGGQRMLAKGHRLKLGFGVVGFAALSGQPRIALDVGDDAVYFENPDLPETHSEIALPLRSRGEIVGVLDVQSTQTGAFSSEDFQILTTLANQVSIAFENTRLLTETRAALAQVEEVYNEFTRTEWTHTISLAEQPGFRYQAGRIEMLEEETQSPEVLSAVESGTFIVSQPDDPRESRSSFAVPVKLRGEVIGVLHIESTDKSKEWEDEEITLVEAVAERAAFAMENARLFQEARRRAAKEQLISEATNKISSALNLENILRTTADELERVLGGAEILIQFQNKEAKP